MLVETETLALVCQSKKVCTVSYFKTRVGFTMALFNLFGTVEWIVD